MVVKLYTANFAVSKNNKNKCKMKKIIVLAMMFSVTFFNRATANKAEDSSSPKKIEIVTDNSLNNENEYERNLNYPIIDALLYSDIKQVEVTLYNIGKADIYIIDSQNQIINNMNTNTDSPITVNLSLTNKKGVYYVIIISDYCYAEGKFLL